MKEKTLKKNDRSDSAVRPYSQQGKNVSGRLTEDQGARATQSTGTNQSKFKMQKGKPKSSAGKVKQVAGKTLNGKGLETRGLVQKGKGNGQQVRGAVKEKIQKSTWALGDGFEKVGRKLQKKGYGKVGGTIEKIGDRLKHIAGQHRALL